MKSQAKVVSCLALVLVCSAVQAQVMREIVSVQRGLSRAMKSGVPAKACGFRTISCGDEVLGEIEIFSDCFLDSGIYADFLEFYGSAGDQVSIRVIPLFNGLATLQRPSDYEVVASDHGFRTLSIESSLSQTGFWAIGIANLVEYEGGLYTLELTCNAAPPPPPPPPPPPTPGDEECEGRASTLMLHGRFEISGEALLQGDPAPFFLQNICSPEGVSPTALAFYFNAAHDPRQEGFISITDNCDSSAETFKVEVATASTRRFVLTVEDTWTGIVREFDHMSPGFPPFFPVDRDTFAPSCLVTSPP